MKNIYLITALLFAAFTSSGQNFFFEDFDGCDLPSGWTNTAVVGDTAWVFGDNAAGSPAGNVDGSCMAYVHDDDLGGGYPAVVADLVSPTIDLSSLDTALLQFDYVFEDLGASYFAVALWNGADWDTVLVENTDPGCFGFFPTCTPRSASIDLTDHLISDFQIKFIFDDGAGWNWYIGLDNVAVYVPPAKDAVAVEEIAPESACGLSAAEMISLIVFNNGLSDITSIDAGFAVGAQTASESFTVNIAVGETDTLDFVTTVDMSAIGVYDFAVWVELAGDQDTGNDTVWFSRQNIPVISTLPYSEGFESGNGFWNSGGVNSSWELGVPANTIISEANNGMNAWVTNLTGEYPINSESYVESPCFDFSGLTVDPIFRFAHIFSTENCCDEGFIDISLDGGANWSRLGAAGEGINWYDDATNNDWDGDGASDAGSMWRTAQHVLDGAAGQSQVKLRIAFSSDFSVNGEGFGFDDIEIFEFPTINAGVTEILSPVNGCGLGSEVVTVVIENTGLEDLVDFDVAYNAGAGVISETMTDTLFVGEIDTVTFATPADLSTIGDYMIAAWTEVVGDGDPGNDSTFTTVTHIPVISTLPYMEDFENGAGGWVSGGDQSTWALGDPETAFIDTANSGVNAWVTNLSGFYNDNESSYVESPCFDFSSLVVDPVFRFAIIANSEEGWDGTWVEISTDAGATWSTVGNFGEGTNWYNAEDQHGALGDEDWWDAPLGIENQWFTATHLLDGAAGEGSVKVRVFFQSDGVFNTWDGFAFDDVQVFEQPSINAGVTEIISPVTGCGLGIENVTVVIENFGDANLVDFEVGYSIDGNIVTETITDTLFSATVDTFTFAVGADLSIPDDYDFAAWTAVVGDGDILNDSLFSMVTSAPVITSLPYMTDFESGTDGWYSVTGDVGVWELGDPEGLLIDTANSGVNAWATNLNTLNYQNDQLSYLISPCFDFSSLIIDPILQFAFISNSEVGWDGMWLEVSTDAGTTWSTLGNLGEGTNWYNNQDQHGVLGDEDWWDGNTADTVAWINAEHLIDGVAGSSDVIIRFVFDSDPSINTFEGFAVDDISVTEQPPINGSIFAVTAPTTGCGLTDAEAISVTVSNLGSLPMDSVILSYSLDNGPVVTEIFNDTIQPNNSDNFTFAQTIDLSAFGDYNLTVWVTAIGDGDTSNDTLMTVITSVPTVNTLPYAIDFENGSGGWRSIGLINEWELGDPEGTIIDTAYSGVNAWATNLNTLNYENGEFSVLISPCLDFSNETDDPVIRFAIQHDIEAGWDAAWMEVSTNGGANWSILGNVGEGENWYTNDQFANTLINRGWDGQSGQAGEWVIAEHILDGVAGEADVQVRYVFSTDASVNFFEGAAIDDISIFPQPQLDLVAISMDAPQDGCDLMDEEVTMTFWNKGLQSVSNFELGFRVDGGAAQTETYTGTVNQNDTVTYTFAVEMADLSGAGMHTIDVFTALAGDEDMNSDTVLGNMVENFGNLTPLSQTEMPTGALISSTIAEGTSSQIFFCGLPPVLDGCLEIVSVSIDSLQHTFLSDLDIFLISPAGDTLELSTDNGGASNDISNVVFTDTASMNIVDQTTDIVPGYYHPEDLLGFESLYNGQDPNGAWTLWINDDAGGDDGQLISWTMTFQDNSPMPVLTQGDTTICITQVLTVGLANTYDSYLWTTGNNSQEIDLFGNILGLGTTEISVTVDQDGCTGTSNSFVLTVDACAGIDELAGLTIDMYPNPTAGNIVLEISGESNGFVLEVVDMNGKLVHTETIGEITNGLRRTVDLSNVANGLYFVKLDDGTSSTTRKLIKQ
ncbi:MAG: T9SS type A sorting domain-containing protein [Flavobacteriales bacterium]|nr:T9SS type A sorting domain-containing protein [Flavobacteriales bacterium]MCB9191271.1 T9SS type A sorting domain-containing protein [Flavobacteriales bacterium]MCB9204276.1 T9SS type A sorting domain-containing protein [Flavobacteriales bacterium]